MNGGKSDAAGRPGYVFILTLAAIAALALVLAGAYLVQRTSSDSAAQLVSQVQLERDLRAAQAHALYLLLTAPRGDDAVHAGGVLNPDILTGGLIEAGDPVSVRGAPRRIEINGRIVLIRLISVQGLIGLAPDDMRQAQLFLVQTGHDRAEAAQMAAALADYADEDDLRRLGGAERSDYPDGRAPSNAPLRSARETCAVLGWEDTLLCREDPRLMDLYFSTEADAASQPRFLPDHVLALLIADERALARAQRRLAEGAVTRFGDLDMGDWDSVHEGEFGYGPPGADFLILTHEAQARLVLARRVRLTPGDLARPFETVFDFLIGGERVEQAFSHDNAEDVDAFPIPDPAPDRARGD